VWNTWQGRRGEWMGGEKRGVEGRGKSFIHPIYK